MPGSTCVAGPSSHSSPALAMRDRSVMLVWLLSCRCRVASRRMPTRRRPPRGVRASRASRSTTRISISRTTCSAGSRCATALRLMGDSVGRVARVRHPAAAGVAAQRDGDDAPTYYLQSDAPLYYYSFTDAYIATEYRSLTPRDRARFDPMITGFNPGDMYAADHIRRVLATFPGVFTGIGEFTRAQGVRVGQDAPGPASLLDPALDSVLATAGEIGLLAIVHNDMDVPFPADTATPAYLEQMKALVRRHPNDDDHLGAHRRRAHRAPGAAITPRCSRRCSPTRRSRISTSTSRGTWSRSTSSRRRRRCASRPTLINRYPDRFLFGTDAVAPANADGVPGHQHAVRAPLGGADARRARQGPRRQLRAAVRRGTDARCARGKPLTSRSEDDDMNACTIRWIRTLIRARGRRLRPARRRERRGGGAGGRVAATRPSASRSSASGRRDISFDFARNDPNWFDVDPADRSCPSIAGRIRHERALLGQRAADAGSACRATMLDATTATSRPCSTSTCSASASMPARRRFGCATPTGQWRQIGAGQLESPFMDLDVFPNILEYWGPNGMIFFRNVQVLYRPIDTKDGRHAAHDRARAAGRERRRRCLRRPHRAGRTSFRASRGPTLGRYRYAGQVGLRQGSPESCARSAGIRCRPTRST